LGGFDLKIIADFETNSPLALLPFFLGEPDGAPNGLFSPSVLNI